VLCLTEAACRVTGRRIEAVETPRRPGHSPVLVASSEKIRSEVGFGPEILELEAMVSDAWEWLRAHPNGNGGREVACAR
jgi:UDP-glucose 4-epimerase